MNAPNINFPYLLTYPLFFLNFYNEYELVVLHFQKELHRASIYFLFIEIQIYVMK